MRITLYLLREGVALDKTVLRRRDLFREVPLQPPETADLAWRLFVRTPPEREARWVNYVRPIFADVEAESEIRISSKSSGAVLLVHVHERVFAITFGTGFHALDLGTVELDFGLRVAANCVDPDKITMADARGLGKGRRNATSRLPVPNEVFALGLLTDEEWIRKFGGDVKLTGFAKSARGADSLQLSIDDFDLTKLGPKLRQVLDLYQSTGYREHFPFLDYFRRETDKALIEHLDRLAGEAVCWRDRDVGFAMPDEFDLLADAYRLSRRREQAWLTELRTEDVYDAIEQVKGWNKPLTSVKVEPFDRSEHVVGDRKPLRSYAVVSVPYQVGDETRHYTLTAGAWFRIDQEYVELVDRYLRDFVDLWPEDQRLPAWDDSYLKAHVEGRYGEERYNRWVARERRYVLLDRDLYRGRAGERVEICDLLTKDKQLICVKRMDGSDKMSHLFQQGSVSARMLMTNQTYRDKLMDRLRQLDPTATFGEASQWTVVFAIATSKPGDLKDIMYFFSRAALKMHAEAIKSCGFKVSLAKIDKLPG
ncbi:DUF6119 family protein [Prauserella oleivorans]|uniref:DUF6119 family protein n=1 Tax=Prauserella oleivorans TaxID=1478153 RepID=A0ABW5W918_9PSEU